ncbi:acyltransferase domain-containing protein [Pseudactinotalea sp. Z1739]|uniref:acyltransferase domain-containing protein n=1 Tax=Pseudactinotalea sp. Z1739 TaxID=3413028 RepID=UPI003C7CA353
MTTFTADQVRAALSAGPLDALLTRLRLRAEDHAAVVQHVAALGEDDLQAVAAAATALGGTLGQWGYTEDRVFAPWPDLQGRPRGLIPMLALLAGVPVVRQYHADRGIAAEYTYAALADLGQQIWVFRQVFGEFGLDNQEWLTAAWSGALFWLGRLQVNLLPYGGGHVISTHIPQTGPLRPEEVDDSFALARDFFATHFPDAPARALHCDSWLLDPHLAEVLDAGSNIVDFGRRWRLVGEARESDAAVLYFVFGYRPRPGQEPDRSGLPRRTSLERAVLDHLDAGGHWYARTGLIDLDERPA